MVVFIKYEDQIDSYDNVEKNLRKSIKVKCNIFILWNNLYKQLYC
jgi:hypothetical protein